MILKTSRLTLSKFTHDDADFILQLVNSPDWLRFIGDRNVKNIQDAIRYIEAGPLKSYEAHGFGLSKVSLTSSGAPVGMCGLLSRDYLDFPDIGFAFLPQYFGMGYGYEIASGTIYHYRNAKTITSLCAITVPHNDASIALLKKLDFVQKTTLNREGETLLLFENHP